MSKISVALALILTCAIAQDAGAAVRFKRFPHCPAGLISKKTCECHMGETGRFHFCHAGEHCNTGIGKCSK